jgi:ribonuclease P protein component
MTERYPQARRITLRSDLERIRQKGTRLRTEDIDVRYIASPFGYLRVGIIVPLYGHSAVERNRLKRRLREEIRKKFLSIPVGMDILIRTSEAAYSRSFRQLRIQTETIGRSLLGLQNSLA